MPCGAASEPYKSEHEGCFLYLLFFFHNDFFNSISYLAFHLGNIVMVHWPPQGFLDRFGLFGENLLEADALWIRKNLVLHLHIVSGL
jgi:hypothetical protein